MGGARGGASGEGQPAARGGGSTAHERAHQRGWGAHITTRPCSSSGRRWAALHATAPPQSCATSTSCARMGGGEGWGGGGCFAPNRAPPAPAARAWGGRGAVCVCVCVCVLCPPTCPHGRQAGGQAGRARTHARTHLHTHARTLPRTHATPCPARTLPAGAQPPPPCPPPAARACRPPPPAHNKAVCARGRGQGACDGRSLRPTPPTHPPTHSIPLHLPSTFPDRPPTHPPTQQTPLAARHPCPPTHARAHLGAIALVETTQVVGNHLVAAPA